MSSFATRVWHLIVTQGILYPFGACMLYYPTFIFIDEWFIKKKGLAFGICWVGSGIAGVAFPLIAKYALSRFSFQVTMWAWAILMFILTGPFLPFVKRRLPLSTPSSSGSQQIAPSFLSSRTFIILQFGNILQSLGYFIPSIYLATYARSVVGEIGFGTTAPIVSMNAGMTLGFIVIGLLIDRCHVVNVLFTSAIGAALSVFMVWGISISLPPLCVFAMLYGTFAGSGPAAWPGIVQLLRNRDQAIPAGFVLSLLAAGRGVGSIACGPISEALMKGGWTLTGRSKLGYGTEFGILIVFTGMTATFGALGFGARKLGIIQ
ncbi:hypothetical protein N7532_007000 [Penicillium argentinense]|uniref:Major facilitator superfamily (MFS) profile domain-containing protein n=1 Tax=Penicillium argentinense TaxID=1131581 RepID=A0A9W9FH33_9EURO|nr:uncharacterized protein N7532_007000 [Penicillium argentinense]KAJ5099999.1 hypothetical protein N7532_007000 [Penicillium argentinense]